MTLASATKPETGGHTRETGLTVWPRSHRCPLAVLPSAKGRQEERSKPSGPRAGAGVEGASAGQPHQDQDVGHDDIVALQAGGPVGLELESAVLTEGHRVVVIEGDVPLVSELPMERGPVGQQTPAAWGCSTCLGAVQPQLPSPGLFRRRLPTTGHGANACQAHQSFPKSTPNLNTPPLQLAEVLLCLISLLPWLHVFLGEAVSTVVRQRAEARILSPSPTTWASVFPSM